MKRFLMFISLWFLMSIYYVALADHFNEPIDPICQQNPNVSPIKLQLPAGQNQIEVQKDCKQVTLEVSFADGRVISRQIPLTDLTPSLSFKDEEIELAQIFSPTKDSFETEQEFQQRRQYLLDNRRQLLALFNQAVQQHDPRCQAGVIFLDKADYNADTGNFPIRIEWQTWGHLFDLPKKVNLKLDRDEARSLWKEGPRKPVYISVELVGSRIKVSKQVFVGLGKEWAINNPLPTSLQANLYGHRKKVYSVAFSLDGRLLASSSGDQTIKLWWLPSGELLGTLQGHKNSVYSVAFSPNGNFLASGSRDKTIKLWEINTGRVWRTWRHRGSVWSVAFHPNGELLASGSHDNTLKLWEVKTGKLLKTLKQHNSGVLSVTFSYDGLLMASGDQDGMINIWDVEKGEVLHTILEHSHIWSVAFSPDGRYLASGSNDSSIKIWDVNTSKKRLTLKGHGNGVLSVAFSADGRILASGSDDSTIRLWDVQTGKALNTLKEHGNSVLSVTFSTDGRFFASASQDKTIKLWKP
jgi:WD40 repeat protein